MLEVRVVECERDRRSKLEPLQTKRVNLLNGVDLLGDLLTLRRWLRRTLRGVVAGQWRDMGTIRANMKVDLKEGRESRREILGRYGDVGRWFERGAYDNAERQIKKLQEARNKARRAGKDKLFDRINERIEEIQTRVLRDYARARERSTGGGIDTMFQTRVLN